MNTAEDHILWVLAEECAEVTKEICKAGRFGLDDRNPVVEVSHTQRVMIQKELTDLLAVAEMLVEMRIIESPVDRAAMQEKKRKVLEYMGYARRAGALEALDADGNKVTIS